jgi:ABC-type ATPase involved in cell division
MAFLRRCGEIAAGRPLIFKLHPTENVSRAKREIKSLFPDATVLAHGNVNDMIANAETVVTQQSTCTFVAVALGKETHTYLNLPELRRLLPIQNGGASAHQIANIARRLLHTPMPVLEQVRRGYRARPRWEQA